jgi:hypothetical protein
MVISPSQDKELGNDHTDLSHDNIHAHDDQGWERLKPVARNHGPSRYAYLRVCLFDHTVVKTVKCPKAHPLIKA